MFRAVAITSAAILTASANAVYGWSQSAGREKRTEEWNRNQTPQVEKNRTNTEEVHDHNPMRDEDINNQHMQQEKHYLHDGGGKHKRMADVGQARGSDDGDDIMLMVLDVLDDVM
uniref:Uncharacterized protein n=1 Tax=Cacopsylla melanoneura TaxID=428564 RepID=A0A8D8VW80_9HEMI